jgi:hypothetical protein
MYIIYNYKNTFLAKWKALLALQWDYTFLTKSPTGMQDAKS